MKITIGNTLRRSIAGFFFLSQIACVRHKAKVYPFAMAGDSGESVTGNYSEADVVVSCIKKWEFYSLSQPTLLQVTAYFPAEKGHFYSSPTQFIGVEGTGDTVRVLVNGKLEGQLEKLLMQRLKKNQLIVFVPDAESTPSQTCLLDPNCSLKPRVVVFSDRRKNRHYCQVRRTCFAKLGSGIQ